MRNIIPLPASPSTTAVVTSVFRFVLTVDSVSTDEVVPPGDNSAVTGATGLPAQEVTSNNPNKIVGNSSSLAFCSIGIFFDSIKYMNIYIQIASISQNMYRQGKEFLFTLQPLFTLTGTVFNKQQFAAQDR
jgi:hypothetical protein